MTRVFFSLLAVGALLLTATGVCCADAAGDATRSEQMISAGQYDAAIGLLSGINASDPALASIVGSLQAQCYFATKNFNAALEKYQDLTKSSPDALDIATWYRNMADCYAQMYKFAECFAAIDKAVELAVDPQVKKRYRLNRAWFYVNSQRIQDAIVECQSLIKDYPNYAEPYRCMVSCYFNLNNFNECYAAIDKAIELAADPQIKRNYRQDRAWFYMRGQRNQDAIAECQSLIRDYPNYAEPYRCMVDCYSNIGKINECYAAIDKAVELASDPLVKKNYRQDRAWFYMRGQRLHDSIAECQSLIKDYPNNAEPYRCMADCYLNMWKLDECYAAIDKAIELTTDPEVKRNYRQDRAWFYVKGEKYQDAIAECESLIRDYPNNADPYRYLADCYAGLGKVTEFCAAMDKAVELATTPLAKSEMLFVKAELLVVNMHDYESAIPVLQKLLADYPECLFSKPLVPAFLALALEKTGRVDEAAEVTKSSISKDDTPEQKAGKTNQAANIYFRAKKYHEAIKAFQEVRKSKNAPNELRAEATYRSGLCYQAIKFNNSARMCMEEVVKKYGNSQWARQARGQLYLWGELKPAGVTSEETQ